MLDPVPLDSLLHKASPSPSADICFTGLNAKFALLGQQLQHDRSDAHHIAYAT